MTHLGLLLAVFAVAAVPLAAQLDSLRFEVASVKPLPTGSHIGESPTQTLRFEVASVKPSPPTPVGEMTVSRPGSFEPGGRFLAQNATLWIILQRAFPEFAQPGRMAFPEWVRSARFDIDARANGDAPIPQMWATDDTLRVDDTQTGLTLATAIEDQLGLRLQPSKGQAEVLFVDRIEPPTPN